LTLQEILQHLDGVKRQSDGQYMARCPAHDDRKQSLSVGQGQKGIVLKCQAGCDTGNVLACLGLKASDLFDDEKPQERAQIVAIYDYRGDNGELIAQKLRRSDKSFSWRRPDSAGGWIYNRKGVPHRLYVSGELSGAVCVCEGEKDADNLHKLGFNAASGADGAGTGKWRKEYTEQLRGCSVCVFQDNDDVGREYAKETANALIGVASSVQLLDLSATWPEIPEHGDVSDMIARFGADEACTRITSLIGSTPQWEPEPISAESSVADKLKGSGYVIKDGCLHQEITKRDNGNSKTEYRYLLNGWIEPIGEITRDNGMDVDRALTVKFHCSNGKTITAQTSIKDLQSGNFLAEFGIDCRPAVGGTVKNLIADSVLAQAELTPRQTIYQHTGFRKINGKWAYLHCGGAIGAENITVELSGRSTQYCFPDSTSPDRWDTLKQFFKVAPKSITYPLMAIAFLSPLNEAFRHVGYEPSFVMWLQGVTGTMKSTLAALTLNFFGESWNNKSLPHTFKDSANFLEKSGFLLADVLTVCDDFYPATTKAEQARMAATAQSISRSWGDRVGRSRMNADTSLRRGYPARGNLLCTGEDAPYIGQSGAARNFVVELKAGDIRLDVLSQIQTNTVHLAECMRGYIEWLIPQYDSLPEQIKGRFLALRAQAQNESHGRTTEAIAHLQIAVEAFTRFMAENGQMTEAQAEATKADSWRIFNELAEEQTRRIMQDKPTTLFLSALKELLETKVYAVVALNRSDAYGYTDYTPDNMLGYRDAEYYYLYPETSYKAVKQFYNQADRNFPLSKGQLFKHLKIESLIESGENQTTKQKKIKGVNGKWLWLKAAALEINEDTMEGD
jgi:hypothetical protein